MVNISPNFWRGKRILVTGHTGFKGSWMSLWLQNLGAETFGLALTPPTKPSLFEEARIEEGMISEIADIRDYNAVQSFINATQPEIVIHMAAQPLVRYSYQAPVETYATNVMGVVHILEAVRHSASVRAVLNITTDKCYENKEWLWGYREDDPLGGYDPYSSSKGCSELISNAYRQSFFDENGVALATARAGNVIGNGDWAVDRLVPDILRAFENCNPVTIRNPESIRPWQHVLEPISGYLHLAEKLYQDREAWSEAWNFGPEDNDARTVQWVVEHISKSWGKGAEWEIAKGQEPHEANYLKLDMSKAKSRLNWKPTWNLETALQKIVFGHQDWLAGKDLRELCISHINEFSI